jgi:hypothetical protein
MGNDQEMVMKHMVAHASVLAIDNVRKMELVPIDIFPVLGLLGSRYSVLHY